MPKNLDKIVGLRGERKPPALAVGEVQVPVPSSPPITVESPAEERVRVKPDVYIAALLDEVNDHLCNIEDRLSSYRECDDFDEDGKEKEKNKSKGKKPAKKPIQSLPLGDLLAFIISEIAALKNQNKHPEYYSTPLTAITVATPIKPDSPSMISNPISGSTGYQIESVYNQLGRISPKITVINHGTAYIFVTSSPDAKTWSQEIPLRTGDAYTFYNVWEIRLRSPAAGILSPTVGGGVYSVTEYEYTPSITIADNIGLSEHAARTGSPMSYDRRGNFLYLDNYESPTLKFDSSIVGAGTNVRSTDTAYIDDFSLRLRTGGLNLDRNLITYSYMDFNDKTKAGAQISLALAQGDGFFHIHILMMFFDGTNNYQAEMLYTPGLLKLEVIHNTGIAVLATDLSWQFGLHNWSTLKLVIDLSTKKYARFIIFGREFDLTAYDLKVSPNLTPRQLQYQFSLDADQNAVKTIYLDNHIMTDNEP